MLDKTVLDGFGIFPEVAFKAIFMELCEVFRRYSVLLVAMLIYGETSVFSITLQYHHRIVVSKFSFNTDTPELP